MEAQVQPGDMVFLRCRSGHTRGCAVARLIELNESARRALVLIAGHGGAHEWVGMDRMRPWKAKNAKRKELAR